MPSHICYIHFGAWTSCVNIELGIFLQVIKRRSVESFS